MICQKFLHTKAGTASVHLSL